MYLKKKKFIIIYCINIVLLFQWDSVGELDKLQSLEELVLGHEEISGRGNYALEFTFGRIRTLRVREFFLVSYNLLNIMLRKSLKFTCVY